jgi:hypothetical protein
VVDPFRPPEHPFGSGNRGLEYGVESGAEVRASQDGEVVFAGAVAGSLHVTLLHPDGIRTSYSFLQRIDVALGQQVRRGDPVGRAGERLHFGARRGDEYFDPATLFDADGPVEVELLPFEVPPGDAADEERAALAQLWASQGGGGFGLPSLGDLAGVALDGVRLAHHYATELDPIRRGGAVAWRLGRRLAFPEACSSGDPPTRPAAGERVAVLVGGLGSSSRSASIDDLRADELGYDPDEVVRFSYTGGRIPGTGEALESIPAGPYGSSDTQGDLRASGQRLAQLVQATLEAAPEATVDLYGHSMGGVVARLALEELARRGIALDRIGLVATFGSPHGGADLATAVAAVRTGPLGDLGLHLAEGVLASGLDPNAEAVSQLAETSVVVDSLAAGPPPGIDLLSIAASGDLVVTVPNTHVAGARNVVVDLVGRDAHGAMVGSEAATDEVALALAGSPPACQSPGQIVRRELVGEGISYLEDLGGAALLAGPT